jgi:hypothetical protein
VTPGDKGLSPDEAILANLAQMRLEMLKAIAQNQPDSRAEEEAYSQSMPEPSVFARLVAITEFMLQVRLPEPTRQLLAATVDATGEAMFADWLATYDLVAAADDDDKRLIIREQAQEQWVNRMRGIPHPLPQTLVAIYDAANAPIAAGMPPLTEEAADAILDIYAFQSSIVRGADIPVTDQQRNAWRQHLVACYPMLGPADQQWIAAAPLTAPMMRAGWKELTPAQQQVQRQAWAAGLPQLAAWVRSVMQGRVATSRVPGAAAPGGPQQMTPQQARQNDQMIVRALQNVSNSNYQAMRATAQHLRY